MPEKRLVDSTTIFRLASCAEIAGHWWWIDVTRLNVSRTRANEFLCLGNNFLMIHTQDIPKIFGYFV
jgi:hypothetical protein